MTSDPSSPPPVGGAGSFVNVVATVLALAVGVLAGLVACRGRRPTPAPVLAWPLLVPALVLAVVGRHGVLAAEVAALALLVAVAVAGARRPGVALAGLGLAANLVVTVADGGMPVAGGAAVAAGTVRADLVAGGDYGPLHHLQGTHDILTALDDRIALAPLHLVASIGDLLFWIGLAAATAAIVAAPRVRCGVSSGAGPRWRPRRWPARRCGGRGRAAGSG